MFHGRIKGTHVPRLSLAAIALGVFFLTLYFELVGRSIDFTQPAWAAMMVVFLFAGVLMLVTSWIMGLDTRAELFITLFMVGLHLVFDAYIFVQVFALHRALPVALVQLVVQAYWIAGLLDAVMMYWGANWQRTASTYVSPEQQIAELRQLVTVKDMIIDQTAREATKATRLLEDAHRVYTETCEGCGRVFEGASQSQARAKRDGHRRACKGKPPLALTNGHKQGIPELEERG